jgi:hypothetical protein
MRRIGHKFFSMSERTVQHTALPYGEVRTANLQPTGNCSKKILEDLHRESAAEDFINSCHSEGGHRTLFGALGYGYGYGCG